MLRGLRDGGGPSAIDPVDPTSDPDQIISHYLATHPIRKVQLGAGLTQLDDWLATDVAPRRDDVLAVDATRPLPFPDASIDYIGAEHVIEHVRYAQGRRLLANCLRVLKPGGVMRIATPDLAKLISVYRGEAGREGERFVELMGRRYLHGREDPVAVLNLAMRAWGHRYLYDERALRELMNGAGFTDLSRCEFGRSRHEELRDIERHGRHTGIPQEIVHFETMVIEGTKPG